MAFASAVLLLESAGERLDAPVLAFSSAPLPLLASALAPHTGRALFTRCEMISVVDMVWCAATSHDR